MAETPGGKLRLESSRHRALINDRVQGALTLKRLETEPIVPTPARATSRVGYRPPFTGQPYGHHRGAVAATTGTTHMSLK